MNWFTRNLDCDSSHLRAAYAASARGTRSQEGRGGTARSLEETLCMEQLLVTLFLLNGAALSKVRK